MVLRGSDDKGGSSSTHHHTITLTDFEQNYTRACNNYGKFHLWFFGCSATTFELCRVEVTQKEELHFISFGTMSWNFECDEPFFKDRNDHFHVPEDPTHV